MSPHILQGTPHRLGSRSCNTDLDKEESKLTVLSFSFLQHNLREGEGSSNCRGFDEQPFSDQR
jgi:hypothetical protein